jgi:hypothetical protein
VSKNSANGARQEIDLGINRLSFWSAIIATVVVIFSGITATTALRTPGLVSGILLIPVFVVLMACIHEYAPTETKIYSRLGLLFALGYSVLIGFNYYMQLTLANQSLYAASFDMTDPNSIMWVIEVLGYGFMGLSTLCAAWVFRAGTLENLVRWLFVLNGVLGLGGMIGYALHWSMSLLLGGLIVWDIVMPLSTILLAVLFRKRQYRG